ncbi:hypothetical protein TPHA_0D00990 [Tetrapisispora phaffii CBS 4417]|uniref:Chromatin modification-related protein EAF3 n=1 Tax=Tetrapisispora phaffii (strain ATCC 24235 / CBS 4417 / NBRC 1672 / NRRL Y-8282 / UCD 70-5) TaxID=1071381 RepID=G8BSB9_TETPH|nr:hypothetical protein TPHA_0D00990 [Tetrapisispora phaffii CBS 4417]CCE62740.1 hypothetical protein TPHA_0D00990 [Tetrapisispora phaffii CBS 4417]
MSFELGGKCLAFHGPLLYEAKILKIWNSKEDSITRLNNDVVDESDRPESPVEGDFLYFVHYQGWKASWDEWIGEDRIKEYNEENVELKKKLIADAKNAKKELQKSQQQQKKKSQASLSTQYASTGSESRKKAVESALYSNSLYTTSSSSSSATSSISNFGNMNHHPPKLVMHIPSKLRSVLVNDWEYVTRNKQILKLPSDRNIKQILDLYETEASKVLESPASQSQLREFCDGFKLYFENSLPVCLLYRIERLQFEELKDKTNLIEKYGSIHLLRLLSIIPELISNSLTMDKQSSQLIIKQSELLLQWLLFNDEKLNLFPHPYSVNNFYVNTSSQYEGVALGM